LIALCTDSTAANCKSGNWCLGKTGGDTLGFWKAASIGGIGTCEARLFCTDDGTASGGPVSGYTHAAGTNAYGTSNTCNCASGYTWNASDTTCVVTGKTPTCAHPKVWDSLLGTPACVANTACDASSVIVDGICSTSGGYSIDTSDSSKCKITGKDCEYPKVWDAADPGSECKAACPASAVAVNGICP